jgi:hypothetical protein
MRSTRLEQGVNKEYYRSPQSCLAHNALSQLDRQCTQGVEGNATRVSRSHTTQMRLHQRCVPDQLEDEAQRRPSQEAKTTFALRAEICIDDIDTGTACATQTARTRGSTVRTARVHRRKLASGHLTSLKRFPQKNFFEDRGIWRPTDPQPCKDSYSTQWRESTIKFL